MSEAESSPTALLKPAAQHVFCVAHLGGFGIGQLLREGGAVRYIQRFAGQIRGVIFPEADGGEGVGVAHEAPRVGSNMVVHRAVDPRDVTVRKPIGFDA